MGKAVLVAGLGFGDEGKGSITDFIVRQTGSKLVCRYNGGAQASHAVVEDDRDHRFSQFGSGTFAGARTFLSRFMLFNPIALVPEARHLIEIGVPDPYKLLTIEEGAMLTTPFHVAANRIREMARDRRHHGSCGMGIGETVAYAWAHRDAIPFAQDLKEPAKLHEKCALLAQRLKTELASLYDPTRPKMQSEWDVLDDFEGTMSILQPYAERVAKHVAIVGPGWLDDELMKDQTVVFEGAQGVLLDENYGFHPHTTWSTTTFEWAERLVRRVKGVETKRVGVLRPYMTRHGAGPFVTEDPSIPVPEGEHNTAGRWQESFRMGHFDAVMARYALDVCGGVDELALTCIDHLPNGGSGIKAAWEYFGPDSRHSRLPVNELDPGWMPGPELDEHLAKQEKLGKQLKAMKPVFDETSGLHAFIDRVSAELKTPVKILSYGPTAYLKVAK